MPIADFMTENPINTVLRRLSVFALVVGVITGVGLFFLRGWHRADDFSSALDLLSGLAMLGMVLAVLMWGGPVHHWIMGEGGSRKRLRYYGLACLAAVFAPAFLSPVWMPGPLKILLFMGLFAGIFVVLVVSEQKAKWRPVFFLGSLAAILLTLQLSAQSRLLKKVPWFNSSPSNIAKAVAGTFLDATDTVGSSLLMALDFDTLPKQAKIGSIHLRLAPGSLEAMAGNLPGSAKARYYDGTMLYPDGQWRRIKYRMRGRSIWHWMPEKPSLRIKLRKANPIDLQRHINLVNPEDRTMVANLLGEEIARNMGVLTHRSQFVRLFINNKYFGVYHRTTREDEEMLRLNRRVPGPLLIGEFLRIPWKKEQFDVAGRSDILKKVDPVGQMVDAINSAIGPDRYRALWKSMSFDKLARWDAAMKIAGGSHTNSSHNHLYYFDPRLGRLEPVITDINGHGMLLYPRWLDRHFKPYVPDYKLPLNELLQPLMNAALRDPRFLHRRNELLYEALKGAGSAAAQGAILDDYYDRIDPDVRADRHKGSIEPLAVGFFRQPFSNTQYDKAKSNLRTWIPRRNNFLTEQLDKVDVNVSIAPNKQGSGSLVLVAVGGNAAARLDPAVFNGALLADKKLSGEFSAAEDADLLLHPGLVEDREFIYPVFGKEDNRYYLRPGVQRYLFAAPDDGVGDLAERFRDGFTHSLNGKSIQVEVTVVDGIDPKTVAYNGTSVHPWLLPREPVGEVLLGPGDITLEKSLFVGPRQQLRVAAGTTLRMGPGVAIVSRGPIFVEGTAAAPVKVVRAQSANAWGGILVYGEASAGSRIRHATITGGSLTNADNIITSGMVAFYGSRDTRIEDTTLGGNVISDDTLHVVYGDISLARLQISNCYGDCIDFDYARGSIDELAIGDAGNDGIDFMTSQIRLGGVDINGAGDKGLSIGELSEIEATGVRISNTKIAIAVKDRSKLRLDQGDLNDNEMGFDIYSKNWRYGRPGQANISHTRFTGNQVDARIEDGGLLILGPGAEPETITGDGKVELRP